VSGFASLLAASHNGLRSMGLVACIGLITTLVVSFTVLAAVMQVMWDRLPRKLKDGVLHPPSQQPSDKSKSEAA
jgi:predicted RND superfamily exporter protein